MLGPSHVVRWEYAVKSGALPAPFPTTTFVGGGGLPVWSAHLLAKAKSLAGAADKLLLIVADFRFGNSISNASPMPDKLFVDGYRNISREFLSASVDEALFIRCVEALSKWREVFGSKLVIVHWTGITRRNEDILQGKHLFHGAYQHPTWDLERLQSDDITSLAQAPPKILRALYVDDNLHPSALGFRYLTQRTMLSRPAEALRESIQWLEGQVTSFIAPSLSKPVLIAGDSIWVKSALRLLFGPPLEGLRSRDIHIQSLDFESMAQYIKQHRIARVVFVTDHGPHRDSFSASKFETIEHRLSPNGPPVEVVLFPWAAIAREIVSRRHVDLSHLKATDLSVLMKWLSELRVESYLHDAPKFDANVDLGVELIPTLKGIGLVLSFCR